MIAGIFRNNYKAIILTGCISYVFSKFFLALGPIFTIGLLGALLIFLVALFDIKKIFWFLFIWLTVIGILSNLTIIGRIGFISYIDDLLVFLLIVRLFFLQSNLHLSRNLQILSVFIGIFIFITVISGLVNASKPIVIINYASTYLKILVLIISLNVFLTKEEISGYIKFVFFVMLFQALFASIQFFSYGRGNFFVGHEISGVTGVFDSARGFFGKYGAHKLGHFSLIVFIVSTSLFIYTQRKKWLFYMFSSLFSLIISFTEHDYPFVLFFILFAAMRYFRIRFHAYVRLIFIMSVVVLTTAVLVFAYKNDFSLTKRFFDLTKSTRTILNTGKAQAFLLTEKIVFQNPVTFMFGVGPGNYSGPIAEKAGVGTYFKKYVQFREEKVKSTLDYWWSSFITLIGEVGVLGLIFFLAPYFFIKKISHEVMKREGSSNFDKGVSFAVPAIITFFIFISFISNQIEWLEVTFPFAIFAAYIFKLEETKA